ncbi:ATP-binding cassette domain-containing protein [Anaeromyxobacter oryzae]|uniref:ABC transporter ATP-binding protein n=1 Tax=Anaeromyxobacter oryzae TaxID=2918170 RepID=A0ABM7X0F3_9BACT|nr:ATP-binding cassette domain-containing protein [Anaeromyxobacter oryzae]BDG05286.1 ABC transporter ATP-binding protein [Anaeromyxobacter oryzae]
MLELRGVEKRYGGALAAGPLELAIGAGEVVALIGPSGGGKSTVLKLLLGLLAPEAGTVLLAGAPLRDDPAVRRRFGYVVQGGGLFPHLTAAANAALVARHLGWDRARVRARLEALAALARLPAGALERFPSELSGGQAQRVSLMRALFLDPEVLLLDEPLGALDPITRAELQDDLRAAFRALGRTVVLVTHDLAEAAYLAPRLVVLRDGRIVQDGTLEDLVRAPAEPYVSRFVHAHRALPVPPEGS